MKKGEEGIQKLWMKAEAGLDIPSIKAITSDFLHWRLCNVLHVNPWKLIICMAEPPTKRLDTPGHEATGDFSLMLPWTNQWSSRVHHKLILILFCQSNWTYKIWSMLPRYKLKFNIQKDQFNLNLKALWTFPSRPLCLTQQQEGERFSWILCGFHWVCTCSGLSFSMCLTPTEIIFYFV